MSATQHRSETITSETITAKNVDLSNCDREQIHIPGAIQPHGALLTVAESGLVVLQASVNCAAVLGVAHDRLIGQPLGCVFGEAGARQLGDRLAHENLGDGPVHVLRAALPAGDCDVFAHRSAGVLILEVELPPHGTTPLLDLYSQLRATISRLQSTRTLQSFFDLAVSQIRHFTGFERVMAYKFLEDGSGHVIAESKLATLEPYLGLHYPASDIPQPARRMFALSPLRHLPNVDYAPVALAPEMQPATGEPVDMSHSILRSVSIMYQVYLQNMGVKATMVMPLMKEGQLWGLISCVHHSSPRHVAYEARMASEFLAHMLSLMMAAKEDAESFAYRLRMKAILDGMMQSLDARADLHMGLAGGNSSAGIDAYIESGGAAVVTEEQVTCVGATPTDPELRALVTWLASSTELVQATDRLPELYPPAAGFTAVAAGLLAVRLSKRRPEFVIWFRPEQAKTVVWAGNPVKPEERDETDGMLRLRPRGSFALWQESVAGRSRPWASFEVAAAADLRWAIVEVILARAEQTELLNRELTETNAELDSFAYVASHDLKEPLRGISHMVTFLKRSSGDKLDQQEQGQLATIVKLTRRMDELIDSLLHFSRLGRAELPMSDCDVEVVLNEALLALRPRIEEANALIRRPRPLPWVTGNAIRLRELLTNLISNAAKFNDKPERWVEIGWVEGDVPAFYVRDNGIGIAERDRDAIFDIFRRLHGRDSFGGGTGAGLTIARKAAERHGGRMWAESVEGEGTTLWFTLDAAPIRSEPS